MPGDRFIELAMTEGSHVLEVMFQHASEAITVQDTRGRLVYANDAAARMMGFDSAAGLLGLSRSEIVSLFDIIDKDGDVLPIEQLPGRRVLAGEPVNEQVIGYRRRNDRRVKWSRVSASPIKNDKKEVVLVVNYFTDITDQVRQDEVRQLMARVHEELGSSLDMERNLRSLAKLVVPRFATWCAVHIIDEVGMLASVAVIHPVSEDDEEPVKMRAGERMGIEEDRIQARVVRSRKPELIRDITSEMIDTAATAEGAEFADLIRRMDMTSVLCIPLRIGHETMGTLTLARSAPEPAFSEDDTELLLAIGDRAGITLENARLYEHEHEAFNALERGLTPSVIPEIAGLEIAARYRPLSRLGHVGGDFYDLIPLSSGGCAFVVGDIEGKGIGAAVAVGISRHTLRATIQLETSPEVVVNALNRALRDDLKRMCTLAYLILDRQSVGFRMRVTLAGHPPPIVITADGQRVAVGRPCPPAGVIPQLDPVEVVRTLLPGDTVIAYTDGFSHPPLAPPESMEAALVGSQTESLDGLLDRLLVELEQVQVGGVTDDVALLALRVAG